MTALASLAAESVLQSGSFASSALQLASPRSTAFDIAATGASNPNCARYEQTFASDERIHVVFRLPEDSWVDAILLAGTFSTDELVQISDIRFAVSDSADEPHFSGVQDCAGGPFL